MKKIVLVLFTFLFVYPELLKAQDTIDVVEKNIKVGALAREDEYYGFAEGDKVIVSLTVEGKKELKDFSIAEYPDNVKFADHGVSSVQNKSVQVLRNAVYKFEYYNSNISPRVISIKIQRIPRSEKTKFFNTGIKWENKLDTQWRAQDKTYLASSDSSISEVINTKARVHSQTNLNSSNVAVIDYVIPANTVKWMFWIGVGDEADLAFKREQQAFMQKSVKFVGSIDPLAGLLFGAVVFSKSPLQDNVKYYFLPTYEDAVKFNAGQIFKQFKQGDVSVDYGVFNYPSQTNTKYYLGLINDNLSQGIDVYVRIAALVVKSNYKTITEKVPVVANKLVPVLQE